MFKKIDKKAVRRKKHLRLRKKLLGNPECPRLAVYRSAKHIYAQVIDDTKGVTLASASTLAPGFKGKPGGNLEAAKEIGLEVAKNAKEKGVEKVVFDRGGLVYHGRVAAVAEGAREGGLDF